jgi:hypothetical protein
MSLSVDRAPEQGARIKPLSNDTSRCLEIQFNGIGQPMFPRLRRQGIERTIERADPFRGLLRRFLQKADHLGVQLLRHL